MLDTEAFGRLLEPKNPAISLYLPLEPEQRDLRAPAARLRDLIGSAGLMLERDGVDQRRRDDLLDPIRRIADETDFARHRDPVFAIFASEGTATVVTLPKAVVASVTVAAHFHIKPLLPFLASNRRFYILALSKTNIRLLDATPFSWRDVPLGYLPPGAQAELDSRSAESLADPAVAKAERRALQTETPLRIEATLKAALGADTAPVVLVADSQIAGHFLKQTSLPQVLKDAVPLNPFSLSDPELHAKAMERIDPLLLAELDAVLEQAKARLGSADNTVAIKLDEILQAAQEGRVDSLVVSEDEAVWGRFISGAVLNAHGTRAPHDEDLLNHAAVLTLSQGGRAFAVPRERLPRQVPACAVFRY